MKLINNYAFTLILLIFLMALTACGSSDNEIDIVVPPPMTNDTDYQQLINASISESLPGVILNIDGPTINFIGSAGLSNIENNTEMLTNDVMPTGSSGKKATALLVGLLYEQGMLDIDLTIDQYLPAELLTQIENSEQMTIRQLLRHTAGVHDYLDDATAGNWFDAIIADPTSIKTDEYALQFALNQPAYFEPGTDFQYSNSGYLLAGLILDQVLGEHHYRAMRELVFEPLGLQDTYYNALEKERGEIISGYFNDEGALLDTKPLYENIGVADAPLISSVTDMSKLIKSIVTDTTLISDQVRALLIGEENLTDIGDGVFYGMGMMKETINGKTVYHHGGDEPGYMTTNIYVLDNDTSMTLFVNCNSFDTCESQASQLIDSILVTLLE